MLLSRWSNTRAVQSSSEDVRWCAGGVVKWLLGIVCERICNRLDSQRPQRHTHAFVDVSGVICQTAHVTRCA
jgi:hypothetical protein